MAKTVTTILKYENDFELSIQEIHYSLGVDSHFIQELIDEGILKTRVGQSEQWRFSDKELYRIRQVLRLKQDLGINIAGAALALDLLSEIERLHHLLDQE